jgi:hypothetical protein
MRLVPVDSAEGLLKGNAPTNGVRHD